jgi:MOSC domain-containing protein YiiM
MPDRFDAGIDLVAVAVGKPAVLGISRQQRIISGIRKREVDIETVRVGRTNIEGDGQADLVNHGGVDKAIYCYPRQHRAHWLQQLGYDRQQAPFGENLSVLGVDETTVCIGDTWRWGYALLQVSQPRWPCYKLAMHTGHDDMVKRFVASGMSGWYLRVLEEGEAPTAGPIAVESRDPEGVTVDLAFRARRRLLDDDTTARVMAHPLLAEGWRK